MSLPIEIDGGGQLLGQAAADFLRDYWQKAPLLIRQALPDFRAPLSGNDLAALSLHEEALSRLVHFHRRSKRWRLESGPFEAEHFDQLPPRDWSLLVQDVDKWDPDVGALLAHFEFLPRWRIDDIMVSFAAPGGSVGAHVDQYDVFLLQGEGRREWAIDAGPAPDLSLQAGAPLKLLQHFSPTHRWVLSPGDMLYLPPGVPHHGVAIDPCLTLSIGMRAPALAELLQGLVEEQLENWPERLRYQDRDLQPTTDPAELDGVAVGRLAESLNAALSRVNTNPAQLTPQLLRFLSRYRAAREPQPRSRRLGLQALQTQLARGARLCPDHWLRWLHDGAEPATLAVAGRSVQLPKTLAASLCAGQALGLTDWLGLAQAQRSALLQWVNEGMLRLTRR